ncbi:hypothetical protein [Rubrivirga sp.]|uniref:hypothetical protein n=1 Tax=Rubrivirga sp. TaxID=1885344 RepID=UPI003C778041
MMRSLIALALGSFCAAASAQGPPPFPTGPPAVGSSVVVSLDVVLGGAFNGSAMRTDLLEDGLLPTSQPYGAASFSGTDLAYAGAEDASSYLDGASDVVDWVLVELRTSVSSAPAARAAALVRSDGTVVRPSGQAGVSFDASPGDYYVVVRHRNHLAVMSASVIDLSSGAGSLDLTAIGAAHSNGGDAQVDLGSGVMGMWGGDGSADGRLTSSDRNTQWLQDNGTTGYRVSDFDLNGRVTASDPNVVWLPGNGRTSQVPTPSD